MFFNGGSGNMKEARTGAVILVAALTGLAAAAAETVTYGYDTQGRVKSVAVSGGPANGTNTAICYDAANNRERFTMNGSGSAACSQAPYPTPTPTAAP
ncbi:hypothetical protein FPZ54_09115 [Sphingomonas suaedae]|uniref:RHS repeat protein n=1 Tax=Sphingomonas suaedae TaxID=2599297 RepID=A0A518RFC7_9SPHN|nr:hypothetical protein [Sphingomonas suaedae]QDX26165.1 hypothetical protein FPZ54_09115 [Sphingomonas suaedae]